jgi:hypothetical protein
MEYIQRKNPNLGFDVHTIDRNDKEALLRQVAYFRQSYDNCRSYWRSLQSFLARKSSFGSIILGHSHWWSSMSSLLDVIAWTATTVPWSLKSVPQLCDSLHSLRTHRRWYLLTCVVPLDWICNINVVIISSSNVLYPSNSRIRQFVDSGISAKPKLNIPSFSTKAMSSTNTNSITRGWGNVGHDCKR